MVRNKFSSVPPLKGKKADDEKYKEFILGAEPEMIDSLRPIIKSVDNLIEEESFPWEDPKVRDDVFKPFNLRLPEEYYLKLDYLSKIKKESKQRICLDILLSEIDRKLTIK